MRLPFPEGFEAYQVFVILLVLTWTSAQPQIQRPPVRVTVFYETMHNDSREFIVDQLEPAYNALAPDYMEVELVPYGKGRDVRSDPRRTPITHTFYNTYYRAQYQANKLHACAVLFLTSANPIRTVEVISCALAYPDGAMDARGECFRDVSPLVQDKINACAVGTYGNRLLSHNGRTTHALHPPIRLYPDAGKIPRIIIDGEYDPYTEMMATIDLKLVICRKFRGSTKRRCKRTPTSPKMMYPVSWRSSIPARRRQLKAGAPASRRL